MWWSTATCGDTWAAEAVDSTRRRLVEIADALSLVRVEVDGVAAEAQWDSDAARAFRRDADALAADVASLVRDVGQLRDDLIVMRAHAVQRATWACG